MNMSNQSEATHRIGKITAFFMLFIMAVIIISPVFATPQEWDKVVRVGWYESPFNKTDSLGRRSGYAYEYQQKIAAHTGWTYAYVEGSWQELLQKLEAGEIDLLSDVSYTEERAQSMYFSSLPMGTEDYYVFVSQDNTEINGEDYTSLNGKTIGVNAATIQVDLFNEWAEKHGVSATLTELTVGEDAALELLNNGDIDAYITVDAYNDFSTVLPIFKIGSSDFYFAVNNNRKDILGELDLAMSNIQEENKYYNRHLYEKYIKTSGTNLYFSSEEKDWLSGHRVIRIGYQDNYLAFCAADRKTGKLTGALKDYLDYASDCMKNAQITFEAYAYPTAADAIEAMQDGKVDCVFPVNFSDYDAEKLGIVMTPPLMSTGMYAVIRESEQKEFAQKQEVTVAVNEGNPNYDIFLADNFPGWKSVYFKNTPECLLGVARDEADCIIVSNYRFGNISELCKKYHLTTVSTGVDIDYCFAINRGNTALYSIMAKVIKVIPDSVAHAALAYYSAEDIHPTFSGFVKDNVSAFILLIILISAIIISLLFMSLQSAKKANEEKELILKTETDDLTGLYNKDFFFEYVNKKYAENPEKPMDAIVLNIEQFQSLNTIIGHGFGERILHALGDEIHKYLQETEGIAGHLETEHFGIYCKHQEDYNEFFDRLQNVLDNLTLNASVKFRMGVMPYQEDLEPAAMFESAQTACNMVRKQFKKRLIVFDETIRTRELYEQHLLNDLRRAIENREFVVYYQPQYDIQSETPKLRGAEALVRWKHPTFGIITPSEFIQLFEQNGQIGMLDEYVWEEAFRQTALWQDKYSVPISISVNISRIDVFDTDLVGTLDGLLNKCGLNRESVNLEITESAYTGNSNNVAQVLTRLNTNKYKIEMDDFGTGYSSLSMLSSIPIDTLKMDGSFIRNIESDEKSAKMVELILNLAKNLKIPVVAEGVETEYQVETLKKLGCQFVQGFYFSPAIPAQEFEDKIIKKLL